MSNYKLAVFLIFFILRISNAFAGGWVFGGGDQVGDKYNPWFLYSDKKIKFCISIDKKTFSADEGVVQKLVERSLEYWRSDFERLNKLTSINQNITENIKPAIQGFELASCATQPELRFLFGSGSLSIEEKSFLSNFEFVSSSVRTAYDSKKLVGRGFVYIPSDIAEKSFLKPDQVSRPWQIEGLLYRVLVHEVGHVYGVQHSQLGLMRADYPENIIKKMFYTAFSRAQGLPSSIFPDITDLKLPAARVVDVEKSIKVVRSQTKLLQSDVVYLPSYLTLEWSTHSKNISGGDDPLLIRSSPYLYEVYSVVDNAIKLISKTAKQCRPDSCISDY